MSILPALSLVLLFAACMNYMYTAITVHETEEKFLPLINAIQGPSGGTGAGGAKNAAPFNASSCSGGAPSLSACTNETAGLVYLCTDSNIFYSCNGTDWVPETSATITGPTGATGQLGETGASGHSGTTGATGATGLSGSSGATGGTGTSGVTGPSGVTGASGRTGSLGASGAFGGVGATGATGSPGVAQGATGAHGGVGATGMSGPTGATPNTINVAKLITVGMSGNLDPNCPSLFSTQDFVTYTRIKFDPYCTYSAGDYSSQFIDITYSPPHSMWVSIAQKASFTPRTVRSSDGYVWYYGNGMPNITTAMFITWASGVFVTGGADPVEALLWTSIDGINFSPAASNLRTLGLNNVTRAAFSVNENRWLAVGGPYIVSAVTPAGPWQLVATTPSQSLNSVCYSVPDFTWMVVGASYAATLPSITGPITVLANISGRTFFDCGIGQGGNMLATNRIEITQDHSVMQGTVGNSFFSNEYAPTTFYRYRRIVFDYNFHRWSMASISPFTQDTLTTFLSNQIDGSDWSIVAGPGIGNSVAFIESA